MALKLEQIEQINLIAWFKHEYPEFEKDIHHFANERKCSVIEGRILKRMGVIRGVSDIFIAIPANGKAGLWVELKVGDGKLSSDQKIFLERKTERGYDAVVAWGANAAKEIIKAYLGTP